MMRSSARAWIKGAGNFATPGAGNEPPNTECQPSPKASQHAHGWSECACVKPASSVSKTIAPLAPASCKRKPSGVRVKCQPWPKRSAKMTSSQLRAGLIIEYDLLKLEFNDNKTIFCGYDFKELSFN
jgi:hypothetical protein